MNTPPDLSKPMEAEKDCLILDSWPLADRVQELTHLVKAQWVPIAVLEAKLGEPPKTSDNTSRPPSSNRKTNRPGKGEHTGPRAGSVGRKGGGRSLLCAEPMDNLFRLYGEVVIHVIRPSQDAPANNNASKCGLQCVATYRKLTGGLRSAWGPTCACVNVKSVIGTTERQGVDAYQALLILLTGHALIQPG